LVCWFAGDCLLENFVQALALVCSEGHVMYTYTVDDVTALPYPGADEVADNRSGVYMFVGGVTHGHVRAVSDNPLFCAVSYQDPSSTSNLMAGSFSTHTYMRRDFVLDTGQGVTRYVWDQIREQENM